MLMIKILYTILLSTTILSAQVIDCSDLFFSEYVEGYGQNKAIEIFNPTSSAINLSAYTIERYSNGSTNSSAGGTTNLSGSLASGDAFVLTNGDTDTSGQFGFIDVALYNIGDLSEPNGAYPTPMHMNGNDALVLTKNGAIVDVFGRVGEDPGVCWTDHAPSGFVSGTSITGFNPGTWYTTGHTLIRKQTVLRGDNDAFDLFNPSLEWDTLPVGTWSYLGSHTCNCLGGSYLSESEVSYLIYPNPVNYGSIVNIKSTKNIKYITLTNMLGQTSLYKNKINTSTLSQGAYVVKIEFYDGNFVENKLLVK